MAFAATLALGVAATAFGSLPALFSSPPAQRPTVSASAPFFLEVKQADGSFKRQEIRADGAGCEILSGSDLLHRACVLTTNLEPAVIAGEAFGRINAAPTPSLEADQPAGLIKRARRTRGQAPIDAPDRDRVPSAVCATEK